MKGGLPTEKKRDLKKSQPSTFKVIPQYCIAHSYCAQFLRH